MRLQVGLGPSHWTRGNFAFHLTRSYLRDKTRGEMVEYGGMEMAVMKKDLLILGNIPDDEDEDRRFAT